MYQRGISKGSALLLLPFCFFIGFLFRKITMRRFLLTIVCLQIIFCCYAQRRPSKAQQSNDNSASKEPLSFINPTGGSIRRGQKTIIEWVGGTVTTEKELTLYKGDRQIASFGKMKDVWLYSWKVSRHLEKGDDYTFRLSGEGPTLVSNTFAVKPKLPLLVKLSPLLLVAAIIPFINKQESTSPIGPLPGAPDPE